MSQEQEETSVEKMKRLANEMQTRKMHLQARAKKQLIQIYQHELKYALREDQFVENDRLPNLSRELMRQVVKSPTKKLADFHQVRGELDRLKEESRASHDQHVIFFYQEGRWRLEAGFGIKLALKEVWGILEHIQKDLDGDIFVTEEGLTFGFGVETEEYDYLLTAWGL